MSISYNKLWKLLIDRNMNKSELRKQAKISTNAIAKMGKNEPVSMDTMDKVCKALHCNIGDVMDFISDDEAIG
ncbi:MAG: helix-turn-helix transcriptional regulator [Christensenellaceae bacterium]